MSKQWHWNPGDERPPRVQYDERLRRATDEILDRYCLSIVPNKQYKEMAVSYDVRECDLRNAVYKEQLERIIEREIKERAAA